MPFASNTNNLQPFRTFKQGHDSLSSFILIRYFPTQYLEALVALRCYQEEAETQSFQLSEGNDFMTLNSRLTSHTTNIPFWI
jgi:hypothetical protein